MLIRKPDWVEQFHEILLDQAATPYAWGTFDCCSFVCDCIHAMTGTDPYTEFRGAYTDEAGADAAMLAACGSSDKVKAIEYITGKCAMEGIAPHLASRGDVVLLGVDEGFALGIVALDGMNAAAVAAEGLHRIALTSAIRAWRV